MPPGADDRSRTDDRSRDDDRTDDDRTDDDRSDDRSRDDDRSDDRRSNGNRRERELASEAANYRRKLRDRERELEDLRAQSGTDSERAIAEAVRKREDELTSTHRRELARLRVEALAAAKLRDPSDVKLLDLDELAELADDDRALRRAAEDAIADLLDRKPYLGRDGDDDRGDDDRSNGDRSKRDLGDVVSPGRRGDDRDTSRSKGDDGNAWLRDAGRKA